MKKLISTALSLVMILGSINCVMGADQQLTSCVGVNEGLYAIWSNDSNGENAQIYYKKSDDKDYISVDEELVRGNGNEGRVDIVGLSKGNYDIKIVTSAGTQLLRNNIPVSAYDRSGYAHFNNDEGVGAYNDDGTPKTDADIIYLTNDNKNTVTYNGKTGIGNIVKSSKNFKNPVIIRVIGTVETCLWDKDQTQTTDIANGRTPINNLTNNFSSDDTYINMADVQYADNITVEGIGDDAVIERWGFTFSHCNNIEVRNLTFQNYPEDACSYQGGSNSNMDAERFWLHNCRFNQGLNWCDLTTEQDKGEGDGSTDIKYCKYVTFAYNHFYECHKTSLHGGGNSAKQYHITWHHNYFEDVSSRMPLIRQANMHSYNNYYYNCGKCIDARASAWVLSECNYFEKITGSTSGAYKYSTDSTNGNPVIKAYNDVLDNAVAASSNHIISTTDRTATYTFSDNYNPYPNFDTDSSVFYYDSVNKCSNVEYLTSAAQAKADCVANSGVLKTVYTVQGTDPAAVLYGDVNNSGFLDLEDCSVILKYILGVNLADKYDTDLADADRNGVVDVLDAIYVKANITEATTEATTYVLDITSGLTVGKDYNGISVLQNMSYSSASATINGTKYNGYVAASSNPTFTEGVPTGGSVLKIVPKANCSVKLAIKVNNNKTFYLIDDSLNQIGTYSNTSGSSVYKELNYSLEKGKTYYVYSGGSKMPIYYVALY